ncbi:MAG: hypothetical protein OCD00_15800 [Colwellia sp.]
MKIKSTHSVIALSIALSISPSALATKDITSENELLNHQRLAENKITRQGHEYRFIKYFDKEASSIKQVILNAKGKPVKASKFTKNKKIKKEN